MTLADVLEVLDLESEVGLAEEIGARLPASAPVDWRKLAVALALRSRLNRTRVLGIGGGQGAGKTTLAGLIAQSLDALGIRNVTLSLDDFYLTRAQRVELAQTVHPLLATRGVPGTHDVALAVRVIKELLDGDGAAVPRFDKSRDDRGAELKITGAVDLVIFEGWCVGARPQPPEALELPCNDLEQTEDGDRRWRRYVNERLTTDYPRLWQLIDDLLFLAVPDLAAVRRWRSQQEAGLVRGPSDPAAMNAAQLHRFIAHYERLTGWMLRQMPAEADITGWLDGQHRLRDLTVINSDVPAREA